ncbi:UDP-N-acetylglucosamine 2-epimerase (non-hydrolyzing) [bacterium]|nr:UDP-N-acetylglucosamine 2-epimerase (non-hydrolyzing) [bacterium]
MPPRTLHNIEKKLRYSDQASGITNSKKGSRSLKLLCVAGARPNFMKIAPILREMKKHPSLQPKLVHTGQHYDNKMSDIFFKELQIPEPDIHLNVGSGTHAEQTAEIMKRFETVVLQEKPDWVVVLGDINSTLACSVTASKLHVPVAHVEAGLRSSDRSMPEEINRLVTDAIAEVLFTTEKSGNENLLKEGKSEKQIYFTGNVMIDSLVFAQPQISQSQTAANLKLSEKSYCITTLHRPSNVDNLKSLSKIFEILHAIQLKLPVVFPIHPRTRKMIETFGLTDKVAKMKNLKLMDPVGYFDFVGLTAYAKMAITDSGGLQEETTYLGIPCLTMRENTERPITIEVGTNTLVGLDEPLIHKKVDEVLNGTYKKGNIPELWDGRAAERITNVFIKLA